MAIITIYGKGDQAGADFPRNTQDLPVIPGYVCYWLNGQIVVRKRKTVSRSQVMSSPEFANSRRAMRTLGDASKLNKLLRRLLEQPLKALGESKAIDLLKRPCYGVMQSYYQEETADTFELRQHSEGLSGLSLSKNVFRRAFHEGQGIRLDAERQLVLWDLCGSTMITPKHFDYFELILVCGVLPRIGRDPAGHLPIDSFMDLPACQVLCSPRMKGNQLIERTQPMTLRLPDALADGDSVVVARGIRFYKRAHDRNGPYATGMAFEIAGVY